MEGEIGRFRRRHLVPVPAFASLAALNQLIAAGDLVDDGRVITARPVTIAAAFAAEQPAMGPLPAEPFDPAAAAGPGGQPGAGVRAAELLLRPGRLCGSEAAGAAASHPRRCLTGRKWWPDTSAPRGKYAEILVLDHYLEVLRFKPGALPGATALAPASAADAFTAVHQAYWDSARRRHGDAEGTRALIEVLLAHRTLPAAALQTAMTKATDSSVLDAQAMIIDARRQAGRQVAPVIPIAALTRYDRPVPAMTAYDQLLIRTIP